MQYGFSLVVRGPDANPDTFARIAERAEQLEIDSLWLSAHIVLPPQRVSDYAMVPGRRHSPDWHDAYWEPFTLLGYLAAQTQRIRLGTSVVVLPMHNPFEIAKFTAQIDQFSRGRFVLGVGVGWFLEEFEVLGQNYRNRGRRTDDALRLMKHLWTSERVSYDGEYYRVEDASFTPKPVQRPHPPLWIAGGADAALRRAAEFGDAWHPVRLTPAALVEARKRLEPHLLAAGRAPASFEIPLKLPLVFGDDAASDDGLPTRGRPADIADGIKRYVDAGATGFVFDFEPERFDTAMDTMERFAQEVRPKLN